MILCLQNALAYILPKRKMGAVSHFRYIPCTFYKRLFMEMEKQQSVEDLGIKSRVPDSVVQYRSRFSIGDYQPGKNHHNEIKISDVGVMCNGFGFALRGKCQELINQIPLYFENAKEFIHFFSFVFFSSGYVDNGQTATC